MATENKAITTYLPSPLEKYLTEYCISNGLIRKDKSGGSKPALGTGIVKIIEQYFTGSISSNLPIDGESSINAESAIGRRVAILEAKLEVLSESANQPMEERTASSIEDRSQNALAQRLTLLETKLEALQQSSLAPLSPNVREYLNDVVALAIATKDEYWRSVIADEFKSLQHQRREEIDNTLDNRWHSLVEDFKRELRTEIERLNEQTNSSLQDLKRKVDANYFPTSSVAETVTAINSDASHFDELEGALEVSNESSSNGDKQASYGISGAELAKRLGVNSSAISRWKTGERKPSGELAVEFAKWEYRGGVWYRKD